jgi:hypothetical protein
LTFFRVRMQPVLSFRYKTLLKQSRYVGGAAPPPICDGIEHNFLCLHRVGGVPQVEQAKMSTIQHDLPLACEDASRFGEFLFVLCGVMLRRWNRNLRKLLQQNRNMTLRPDIKAGSGKETMMRPYNVGCNHAHLRL